MGVKIRKMSRRRTRKPRRNKKSTRKKKRKLSKKKLGDFLSRDTIELKNKKLYKFWLDLADSNHSVFIYNDKSHKIIKKNIREEQEKAEQNDNIIAILDSGSSFDAYRELYRKAKNKSVKEVIKNYKRYFSEGSSGKRVFC
jgi:hypothetical protein